MRVRHKATVKVSDDAAGKDLFFAPDDTLAEVVLDGCTEVSSGTAAMGAGATFSVPLGGLAQVRGLFLKATGDFTVSFSGGAAVSVNRGPTAAAGAVATTARVLMDAQVTSLTVVAVTALTLQWCLWGDPTA